MGVSVQKRIGELDFLKCVFILLMVVFHLVYIGDKYPYAKDFVYTFHIPAFLLISGYLMHVEKSVTEFLRAMFWIFVPYMIMESGYIFMSSVLPVREKVGQLSIQLFIEKIFLSPMGPYWYLHTLLICGLSYFTIARLMNGVTKVYPMLVTLSLVMVGLSYGLGLLAPSSAFYFMVGIIIKEAGTQFLDFFRASWWSFIPLALLASYSSNLDRFSIPGVLITYLAISAVLAVYSLLPGFVQKLGCYIGRHTLLILVFSPIFTMLVKPLVPLFSFDPSGMAFMFSALLITVLGCLGIGWIMDRLGISPYFFGKDCVLQSY